MRRVWSPRLGSLIRLRRAPGAAPLGVLPGSHRKGRRGAARERRGQTLTAPWPWLTSIVRARIRASRLRRVWRSACASAPP